VHTLSVLTSMKMPVIKWESTGKSNYVEITDLKKNLKVETSQRKQKATEFLYSLPLDVGKNRNKQRILAADENPSDQVQVQNKFYSIKNMSKLCAEGAIKNLLSMLNYSQSNIDSFWNLCNTSVSELMEQLHEKCMPKALLNVYCTVNPIKKCLWILQRKFRFTTLSKLRSSCLTSVKRSVSYLSWLNFPAISLVNSKLANYKHVVIVWHNMVIDYESEFIYIFTEDSLRQLCGDNTTFQQITTGYGLFPPKEVQALVTSIDVSDWGISQYYDDKKYRRGRLFTH
jgi:hypothetical protein